MTSVINLIQSKFDIKDLGPIRKVLGLEFELINGKWFLHQHTFIEKLIQSYRNISNVKCNIRIPQGVFLQSSVQEPSVEGIYPYRSLIGSLLFLASRSRPDILFCVNALSQFNSHPTLTHWKLLCQVFNYAISTKEYKICLSDINSNGLYAYSDASWASDRDSRKSISGFIVFLNNIPISWRSSKQKCITLSSMESEYIAMTETIKELLWIHDILVESSKLGYSFNKPKLFSDSKSAIFYCKNKVENNRTKHIDIRYHFIKDMYSKNKFNLMSVKGKDNIADLLTKVMSKEKLLRYCGDMFH